MVARVARDRSDGRGGVRALARPEECELSLGCGEPDFEDGLIRACAELNDVDVILTRSADAFKRSKVRAMTCAEYLETFG